MTEYEHISLRWLADRGITDRSDFADVPSFSETFHATVLPSKSQCSMEFIKESKIPRNFLEFNGTFEKFISQCVMLKSIKYKSCWKEGVKMNNHHHSFFSYSNDYIVSIP